MFFFGRAQADASVLVEGLSEWLTESAERSMEAVYGHISPSEPANIKQELLTTVADRLLLGYTAEKITFHGKDEVKIVLSPSSPPPEWKTVITPPNLSPPVDGWFSSDVNGMSDEILSLIQGVPVEALSWGDMSLRSVIEKLSVERLPGWRVALLARYTIEGGMILDVSFVPEQPLALSVTTKINSSSIPAILHSNLKDDLIKGFAPVIGIPVAWLDRHKSDFEALGREILSEEYLVEVSKAESAVSANTGVVSNVDVELESRRYSGKLWMAVYVGAEERYPEMGVHFGRRIQLLPRWDMEMYGELLLQLDDWELEARLGVRWPLWRNIWLGAEWSDINDIWWGRLDIESWARRPYVWLRFSEYEDVNAALGYHINEHISIELHYDSRYDDEWNVRTLFNL
ncbi:MAG: TonB-dependent receptor [Synergistaceae bacterium]|nr:TonB-dependent receptor [Synergistaceae bacterium]